MNRALIVALVLSAPAAAEQRSIRSDYNGGYIIDGDEGTQTYLRPDYSGGYVISGNNGQHGTIRPDYNGGWVVNEQQSGRRGVTSTPKSQNR